MLDIHYIRKHSDELKKNILDRGLDPKVWDVDRLLELDKKRVGLIQQIEEARAERNRIAENLKSQISHSEGIARSANLKTKSQISKPSDGAVSIQQSSGQEDLALQDAIKRGRLLKEQIKKLEDELNQVTSDWQNLIDLMPNITHPQMPVGKSAADNKEIKVWGEKRRFDFAPKDHLEIGKSLDLIDIERAAKVSGSRFYFLKNEAVLMQFGLFNLMLKKLVENGFTPVVTPVLVKEKAMYGTGYFPCERNQVYKIEKSNIEEGQELYLTGTSEQSIVSYEMDTIFNESELPKKYVGYSSCFRSEAGSWGKDVKGIKRVHQFDKIEMIYFTTPQTSQQFMQEALRYEEEILQELNLPYHVLEMCSGDVGLATHRKFDVEVWLPSQNEYMEVQSNSDLAKYHSRRLNIKYRKKDGSLDFVHTISATGITNTRPIAAILDNYQLADGSVEVPVILRDYLGQDLINRGPLHKNSLQRKFK